MSLKIEHVTFNSTDARSLADWWASALGGTVVDLHDGGFVTVRLDDGFVVAVQQVGDPTPGTRRLHLDLVADDLDAEAERLVELGARVHQRNGEPGGFRWIVFTDPDGNEFCVASGD
ncbi:VOC family protein [Nocardioides jishulii]|uniref:VOC family protein n=1 Tax=Nocardioides jishulii TaxID=2575440 RepID=A0A4U2YKP0_9ACTN|nr:VOC family protein [Nocardioides jishulii]QCX27270.1 VOC family protein [Nocardioides jishulii]TKI61757.1 VOC family protein [Nocardioides jishulii]